MTSNEKRRITSGSFRQLYATFEESVFGKQNPPINEHEHPRDPTWEDPHEKSGSFLSWYALWLGKVRYPGVS